MVMMIMMNKNFNCFVFRAGRYLQASGRLGCLLVPTGAARSGHLCTFTRGGGIPMKQEKGFGRWQTRARLLRFHHRRHQ